MTALAARYERHGDPADVIEVAEEQLGDPGTDEALVEVLASPINPADLLTVEGRYGRLPELPAVAGSESVGRVAAVGEGVEDSLAGQLVLLPPAPGAWRSRRIVAANTLVPLDVEADPQQLAMLAVNPATAALMLDLVPLRPGDWIIQNAATSTLAGYARQLARHRELRMVDLTRDANAAVEAGDVVLEDGSGLPKRVADATGNADIRLGLDGVAGDATRRLANCIGSGGTVVNYGAASGEACAISSRALIFKSVALRGFWLQQTLQSLGAEAAATLFRELAGLVADGVLHAQIAATYPLSQVRDAVAHAAQERRGGKVLLLPNAD